MQLEQLIQNKQEIIMIPLSEWTDELSSYDQHSADNATDLYEREKNIGILELLELELEKVNDALNRYDLGQRAICSICGQPIEPQRLKRLVSTTVCSQCAHYYD
ncbi:TraR/DksA C4-type zinc finger protein [Syntrophomonas zehnderi]|nr:TraR/DksA C4-type zinc finger protein [Syntrophomonas zehnderi]